MERCIELLKSFTEAEIAELADWLQLKVIEQGESTPDTAAKLSWEAWLDAGRG